MSDIHTLMFGWEYPPMHLGGLGVACQGIVRGLRHHGVQVSLVLPQGQVSENGVQILTPSGMSITTVASPLQPYDSWQSYATKAETLPAALRSLYGNDLGQAVEHFTQASVELTKNIDPDVIHCHDWMTFEAGARVAKKRGKPLVAHIHATELDRTHFHPNTWIENRERDGLAKADCVMTVSEYSKQLLIKHYGIPADKISVVHNALGSEHRDRTHGITTLKTHAPLVLFLGRLTIQKGADQFLEMAARIHAHRQDVRFVIAGTGDLLPRLIDRTCAMNLQDNVIFAGSVNSNEARALYEAADVFVMPSLSEPFGLVALEAAAHGTPLILSRQSGAAEVMHDAFTVDFWDTAKMADCVLTILREEPLAAHLSAEAPKILRTLTWENQAHRICSLYKNLIHT